MTENSTTSSSKRISTIAYEGTSILFLDWTTLALEGIEALIEESKVIIYQAPPESLLIMSDFTDTRYDKPIADILSEYAISNKPYVKASTLVGMTGMRKILYKVAARVMDRNFSLHDTREEAMKWLVSQ